MRLQLCFLPLHLRVCVHAPVFTGVHVSVCVHSPALPCGPLKLHSLLSSFSSQQAHLEMRFKTAINTELWGVKGHRSDYRIVFVRG